MSFGQNLHDGSASVAKPFHNVDCVNDGAVTEDTQSYADVRVDIVDAEDHWFSPQDCENEYRQCLFKERINRNKHVELMAETDNGGQQLVANHREETLQ
jgi:hypothetical protein